MASTFSTPGVYVQEISKFPPSVAQVETAIPAFIGYTEKATSKNSLIPDDLINVPTRISSMVEYTELFGGPQIQAFQVDVVEDTANNIQRVTNLPDLNGELVFRLFYSLQLFFANGGGACYIVSVGTYGVDSADPVTGVDDGDDTTGLTGGLRKIAEEDEPTLLVVPDAISLAAADYTQFVTAALTQASNLMDRFVIIDTLDNPETLADFTDFRELLPSNLELIKYGAVYHPFIETTLNFVFTDDLVTVRVTSDTVPSTGSGAGSGSGVLPGATTTNNFLLGSDDIKVRRNGIYNLVKEEINKIRVILPPSGAIAGVYASIDNNRGVWKAPANVSLANVIRPIQKITNVLQDVMNIDATTGKSINAIRTFTGKGTMVWGARTLAGNDNEWRYISVRRFFNMVEESVKKATVQFVFEPNDANTWIKVRAMIENYLTVLWRQGALAGSKPDQAFYVRVGLGQTMTALDILEGRMIVEIGMAAVRPAEFIILRFSHKMQEA